VIWGDVEDLFEYSRSNPRPSGIQRLAFEIQRSLRTCLAGTGRLRFVRHAGRGQAPLLREVPWEDVEGLFAGLTEAPEPRSPATSVARGAADTAAPSLLSAARHLLGRIALGMPVELRDPALRAWFLQKDAIREIAALIGNSRLRQPPPPASPAVAGSNLPIRQGDVFLVLGAPWVHADFGGLLRALREIYGIRVALLLYDLVPALRPEWCARDLVDGFRAWLGASLRQCDILLSISRYTAREVEEWARREGIALTGPVRPVPVGTGFGVGALADLPRPPGLPREGTYALFVSTLEARKNHALLVRVWARLLEEERQGLRPPGSVPELVFAGRVGWLVADLVQQLDNAQWFGGRVRLVRDPSDAELRALYEGCLFSLFPSWHEGWGLPVTEALALGVPVLCSSACALPEAGGSLARYFDPGDTRGCHAAVAEVLDDPAGLAAWRAEVRAGFRPTPWSATARAVLEALAGTSEEAAEETAG